MYNARETTLFKPCKLSVNKKNSYVRLDEVCLYNAREETLFNRDNFTSTQHSSFPLVRINEKLISKGLIVKQNIISYRDNYNMYI